MTDYVIIAEGNVGRHVKAIAQEIVKELKQKGEKPLYVEGLDEGDWIVLDYTDFMVHLFEPGFREKYQLEHLWPEGKIIDLNLKLSESDEKIS